MTFAQTSMGAKGIPWNSEQEKKVVRPLLDYDYVNM